MKIDKRFEQVLQKLWRGGKYAYWWSLPSKKSVWFAVDGEWPALPEAAAHTYFGVNPVGALPVRDGKEPAFLRANSEEITAVNCLYADFDVQVDPADEVAFSAQKAGILAAVQALDPPPSAVWSSGGGYQALWFLKGTWLLNSAGNRAHAAKVQEVFVEGLALADKGAKDLTRVLRVVGTLNNKEKYGHPLPVEFVSCDLDLTYALEDLVPAWLDLEEPLPARGPAIPLTAAGGIWLDVESYLQHHGLRFKAVDKTGFTEYKFEKCPMNDHGLDDSRHFLMQYDTGKLGFQCFHGACENIGWQEFKDKYPAGGFWLNRANNGRSVPIAPKNPRPIDYLNAATALGYTFTMNEMNDRLYGNNILMNNPLKSHLITELRNAGYPSGIVFEDTMWSEGYQHQFHPIRDYLNSLTWDGVDYIGLLCACVKDEDGLFPVLLKKWLLAAVERILAPKPECQPPVLLMIGIQGLGKSVLTDFLGSPLPTYTIHSDVRPEEKDYKILAISKFVWEIKEMEGVISRADVSRLKAFFDAHVHTVRAPYGHYDITKPTTACFIGTINDNGTGFLNDPTGSRRYWVTRITGIDFGYKETVDMNQVWAQAVALYRQGERYTLDKETQTKVYEINDLYTNEDPLESYVRLLFEATKDPRILSNLTQFIKRCMDADYSKG